MQIIFKSFVHHRTDLGAILQDVAKLDKKYSSTLYSTLIDRIEIEPQEELSFLKLDSYVISRKIGALFGVPIWRK